MPIPLLFEIARGRSADHLPATERPEEEIARSIPGKFRREGPLPIPEVAELDLARHVERLAKRNHYIEKDIYPLGSCTMKYNPKVHEKVAADGRIAALHPLLPEKHVQGALGLLVELEESLTAITGMDGFTLQPAAGAHGEFTAMKMIDAFYRKKGERRIKVITPDSAHGTNPASVRRVGFEAVEVKSNERGELSIRRLEEVADESTAALMLTLPNTLGLFETQLSRIMEIMHGVGAQVYLDGANMNALLGLIRPGDVGFDVMHCNVHKTFATPHGGGGPGAGPVGVKEHLLPFLPSPRPERREGGFRWGGASLDSIGPVHSFWGNFGVLLKAYAYIRHLGAAGLVEVQRHAVLNANYLRKRIEKEYPVPYERRAMHEFVSSALRFRSAGVHGADIGKRLLDFGFYAPTIAFPLIVKEALMIEPTETESLETIDRFADALLEIAREIAEEPETVRSAPHTTAIRRVNESLASRKPVLRWTGAAPPRWTSPPLVV